MKYKLIIFDFDGTLADSFPYFLSTINTLAVTYDFPIINPEQVDQLRGMDARQLMKGAKLPAWKIPLIANAFLRSMSRDIEQIHLFDGIPDLLVQLTNKSVALAIVSSNSEENVRRVLGPDKAALITYYGCGTSLFGKRHKFKKTIAQFGIHPSDVLCIGDEVRDLDAAQAVNAAFGAVAWGYTRVDVWEARHDISLFYTVDAILQTVLTD